MFLLVFGRHVGAHPDGHQHGVPYNAWHRKRQHGESKMSDLMKSLLQIEYFQAKKPHLIEQVEYYILKSCPHYAGGIWKWKFYSENASNVFCPHFAGGIWKGNNNGYFAYVFELAQLVECRLVSSVGRVPVCCAGGRGFEPQTNAQGLKIKITEENVLPL